MTEITFQYKCRQCGKVYNEGITATPHGVYLLLSAIEGKQENCFTPTLLNVHRCENGMGISDLMGYVEN